MQKYPTASGVVKIPGNRRDELAFPLLAIRLFLHKIGFRSGTMLHYTNSVFKILIFQSIPVLILALSELSKLYNPKNVLLI